MKNNFSDKEVRDAVRAAVKKKIDTWDLQTIEDFDPVLHVKTLKIVVTLDEMDFILDKDS